MRGEKAMTKCKCNCNCNCAREVEKLRKELEALKPRSIESFSPCPLCGGEAIWSGDFGEENKMVTTHDNMPAGRVCPLSANIDGFTFEEWDKIAPPPGKGRK
jgi:hypothetical protein